MPEKDICNLDTWFSNNTILAEETDYMRCRSDLFCLAPRMRSPLRSLLGHASRFRFLKLWQLKFFYRQGSEDESVYYSADEKIDRFIATVIMGLGLIMLIAPLWILAFLEGLIPRLGVISAFIVLFLVLLSITTVAKPFESLAAAAASVIPVNIAQLNMSIGLFQPQVLGGIDGLSANVRHESINGQ